MAVLERDTVAYRGLSKTEVQERKRSGQGNFYHARTSRTIANIVVYNVFTPINIVLYLIGAALIALGRPDDALVSVGTVLFNVAISLYQEIRAKRKLDRIALLARPQITVIREAVESAIDGADIVVGDLLVIKPGDQIVVDGLIVDDARIEVDESQLTGESDAIIKTQGDEVLSGSFCISGRAIMEATVVGKDSFANKLSDRAREFRVTFTPLQRGVNFMIRLITTITAILGFVLILSSLIYDIQAVRFAQIAAIIAGLIPTGMFALVIVNYALGAVRMAGQGTLVQQLNAVESMSSIDVLCTDKTGTLTANRISLHDIHPIDIPKSRLEEMIGLFVGSVSSKNKTTEAIAAAIPGTRVEASDEVAFSSARKWSGIAFEQTEMRGAFVLGATEVLAPYLKSDTGAKALAARLAAQGMRVVLLAYMPDVTTLHNDAGEPALPDSLVAIGQLAFQDALRDGVKETIRAFFARGIDVKVISGDSPDTVAALAIQAGFPPDQVLVSGVELAEMSDAAFNAAANRGTIFGRITPEQKERLVDSLKRAGHYVAMVGDGVNDVLSLKKADIGIAMFSGTTTTRAVADIILLDDSLNPLPQVFSEGKRIVKGLLTSFRIFQARSFDTILTIIIIGMMGMGFPYLPKHNSLTATLVATLPSFLLSLLAAPTGSTDRMLERVYRFVLPAALVTGISGIIVYTTAYGLIFNGTIDIPFTPDVVAAYQSYAGIDYAISTADQLTAELATFYAQTMLTVFGTGMGAIVALFAAPPVRFFTGGAPLNGDWRAWFIAASMVLGLAVVLAVEPLRRFFELVPLQATAYVVIALACVVVGFVLRFVWRADLLFGFLGLQSGAERD